jgi:hypothetical protein
VQNISSRDSIKLGVVVSLAKQTFQIERSSISFISFHYFALYFLYLALLFMISDPETALFNHFSQYLSLYGTVWNKVQPKTLVIWEATPFSTATKKGIRPNP